MSDNIFPTIRQREAASSWLKAHRIFTTLHNKRVLNRGEVDIDDYMTAGKYLTFYDNILLRVCGNSLAKVEEILRLIRTERGENPSGPTINFPEGTFQNNEHTGISE